MACCLRVAPTLLLHINILLVLYAGAALATGARLKWDPSTYVALRELLPGEYRAAAVLLPAAGVALLLLAHFAVAALRTRRAASRRLLLLLVKQATRVGHALRVPGPCVVSVIPELVAYAFLMAAMACAEAALAWWLSARLAAWARSAQAAELQRALALREHLQPLLEHLAHWHPLPSKLKIILKEAESDAPRNLYVCMAAGLGLVLLQGGAVLLALLAAAAARPRASRAFRVRTSTTSTPLSTTADYENAPLRAVYRNGRLMMV